MSVAKKKAVSEARPREDRPPGAPRPGGFSSPRPSGYVGTRPTGAPGGYGAPPRPGGFGGDGGANPRGTKNFGPDAPPKHKRKPHMNRREQGPKPIKERPVSRLYENDEDWRAKDEEPQGASSGREVRREARSGHGSESVPRRTDQTSAPRTQAPPAPEA